MNTKFAEAQKSKLRQEIREGFLNQTDEDAELAMSDFEGYLEILEDQTHNISPNNARKNSKT